MGKDVKSMHSHFIAKEVYNANNYIKRCSSSGKDKLGEQYHSVCFAGKKFKGPLRAMAGEMWGNETSIGTTTVENHWHSHLTLIIHTSSDPAVLLLDIY